MGRFWREEDGVAREWLSTTALFLTAVTVILVMMGSDDVALGPRLVQGKARLAATWSEVQPMVETARGWVGL